VVLAASPLTLYEVVVILLWSTTVVEKFELVETCSRYDVAPEEAFQVRVGDVETPVAPLAGEASVGAEGTGGGGGSVVNDQTSDQSPSPAAFAPFTRQ